MISKDCNTEYEYQNLETLAYRYSQIRYMHPLCKFSIGWSGFNLYQPIGSVGTYAEEEFISSFLLLF